MIVLWEFHSNIFNDSQNILYNRTGETPPLTGSESNFNQRMEENCDAAL